MNAVARVSLTFLFLQCVASTVAWACKCAGDDRTPEERLAAHEQVFVGEVLARVDTPAGCGGSTGSMDPVTFTLAVTEGFKGAVTGAEIELESVRSGASCGVGYEVGEEILVYANATRVDSCDPGGLAADSAEEIEALRAAVAG
jgi:hypothetical protein